MATFDDFEVGQRVAHITVGDGVVLSKNNQLITVCYDAKRRDGSPTDGQYDRRWFELNPKFLFHRSKP